VALFVAPIVCGPGLIENSMSSISETTLESAVAFKGGFLQVKRDVVRLPNGKVAQREYIVHPGAAVVVALLDNGEVVLERQYRHPLGRELIEFPAGKLDGNESHLRCAQRELQEETGYTAAQWAYAGVMHNAIAYSTEGIHIFFARGLRPGPARLDDGEFLQVFTATPQALHEKVASGEVTDAKTITALYWLQNWQLGRVELNWERGE
jgi:ADP-ribose pyrophosphatase